MRRFHEVIEGKRFTFWFRVLYLSFGLLFLWLFFRYEKHAGLIVDGDTARPYLNRGSRTLMLDQISLGLFDKKHEKLYRLVRAQDNIELRDIKAAKADIDFVRQKFGLEPGDYLTLIGAAERCLNPKFAHELFLQEEQEFPESYRIRSAHARMLMGLTEEVMPGYMDEARKMFEKALDIYYNSPYGKALDDRHKRARAEWSFYRDLAKVRLGLGDVQGALKDIEKTIELVERDFGSADIADRRLKRDTLVELNDFKEDLLAMQ